MEKRDMTYSHVDALDVIGRDNEKEQIIELLMQPPAEKSLCYSHSWNWRFGENHTCKIGIQ